MLALFLLWICFNGRVTWDVAAVGLALCVFMGVLLKFALGYSPRKEFLVITRIPAMLRYIGILLVEVVKSNIAVMKLILSPYARLQSQLTFFTPDLETTYARVLLADSITLTPGTITVQLKNGRFCVHTIRDEFIADMEHSTFAMEAARLEAKFLK